MNKVSLKTVSMSAVILASVLAFQNCSKNLKFDGKKPAEAQTGISNSGNGEGYTGKPTVYLARDPENTCGTGSMIRGSVERRVSEAGTQYFLTKENCYLVSPARLIVPEKEIGNDGSGNPLQIVYSTQAYEQNLGGGALVSASYRLFCTSESGATQELPSDALSGGTSATQAPSGMGVWVVRGCDLSGNCQIKNNCFYDGNTGFVYSGNADCRVYGARVAVAQGTPDKTSFQGNGRFLAGCSVTPR